METNLGGDFSDFLTNHNERFHNSKMYFSLLNTLIIHIPNTRLEFTFSNAIFVKTSSEICLFLREILD